MSNLIAKTARYLRREYPANTCIWLAYVGLATFFWTAGIMTGGEGLMLAGVFTMCGAGGIWGFLDELGDKERPSKNSVSVNGIQLVGNTRDAASAHQMQKLITDYTKKLQHMEKLPSQARDKIAAHLADIEPGLKNLRMYDANGNPVGSFLFTRKVYDPAGQVVEQTVASISSNFVVPAPAPAQTSMNLTSLRDALKKAAQPAANADVNPTPADKATKKPRKNLSPLTRARKMRQRARKLKPTV